MLSTSSPTFGDLLREHRRAAGLTQEELAERAGLSVYGIQKLERGTTHPYRDTAQRLIQTLHLTPEEESQLRATVRRLRRQTAARPQGDDATPRHNLPLALSSFIGREQALIEVTSRLHGARLVTLTGVGGCGKTRLALEVARGVMSIYPDGVWLVELAPLTDPDLVPHRVGALLGAHETAEQSISSALASAVSRRRLLLVLDNCEHVLDACAALVNALLRACPELHVLATTREPLCIEGELTWRVPSLPLPEMQMALSIPDLEQNAAVKLFVQRATATHPRFALSAGNAVAVAQICRRLDGLPLALELAAARLEALTAEQLAARLDQRFRLLAGGSRTALPRQQTLWGTLDWSYDLLSQAERELFERFAVFAGGWTLEAAEAVGAGGSVATDEVLELLPNLVRKSLVVAEEQADGTERYRLLETVREYAGQRLAARGPAEVAIVRARHAAFYSAVAGQLGSVAQTTPSGGSGDAPIEVVRDRVEATYDNLWSALGWWLGQGRPVEGLRLAHALGFFWIARGLYAEGRRWLEAMLELADRTARGASPTAADAPTVPPRLRADALSWLGTMASVQGDYARARASHEASVALWRELEDAIMLADDLALLGLNRWLADDQAGAMAALDESLRLCRANGIRGETATTLRGAGLIARWEAQHERAVTLLRESVAEAEAQPAGAYHRAYNVARGLAHLGRALYLQGDRPHARAAFREVLGVIRETGLAGHTLADCLDWLAALEAERGRPERAARLFGAAEAQWRASGAVRYPPDRAVYERDVAAVRAALDEGAFAAAWAEGRALGSEDAVAYALAATEPVNSGASSTRQKSEPGPIRLLSARERKIASLPGRGGSPASTSQLN